MGIKPSIGDTLFIINTLWGTAKQVINILYGGSNVKNIIKYF